MNKELEANTNLSHYRIVAKIGAGGMGEVYLAENTRLHRKVALKVLPEDIASNKDRLRLDRLQTGAHFFFRLFTGRQTTRPFARHD